MIARIALAATLAVAVWAGAGVPAPATTGRYTYMGEFSSLYDCDAAGYVGINDGGWTDYRCIAAGGGYYSLYRLEY
ncbi:hypothetical protein [Micromonospora sp. HUAS LYJ1]|uniref:hypothetical protein n=1 Tax=Micromonospora sp. HUAS LYJ1 TaxID=3061626 RepID=UPI0026718B40|nr:hypothetical protein [Micromonospora sp. HUAS LYJ1]WKU06786.1 hypothetical protein Q2K16_06970 [Micromonospora sp. HUAS LYJ1]